MPDKIPSDAEWDALSARLVARIRERRSLPAVARVIGRPMRAGVGVALFVLGIAAGVTADRLWVAPSHGNPMDSATLLSEMDRRLDLDSAQHATIARVLDQDSAQTAIVNALRPDQRDRYLRWVQAARPTDLKR